MRPINSTLICSLLLIFAIIVALGRPSLAENVALSRLEGQDAIEAALLISKQRNITNIVLFEKQSFSLKDGMNQIGSLILGRGTTSAPEARINVVCFAVFVDSGGKANLVQTIGFGNWEAESCGDVQGVGTISGQKASQFKVGLIYHAFSLNAEVLEPMVLILDTRGHLSIDETASDKASLSGAQTISDIRKALRQ